MNIIARLTIAVIVSLCSSVVIAEQWNFSTPINVTESVKHGVFHHVESSGRRNIAVSDNIIGITWEDDSDGIPRIYLARKTRQNQRFDTIIKVSGSGEAYEPSIAAIGDGRFVIAWEEDEQISARMIMPRKMGPILRLGERTSGQASLVHAGNHIILVHREQLQRFGQIVLQQLIIKDYENLDVVTRCAVDSAPLNNDQLYPVIEWLDNQVNVVWEDRRLGHTVIMHAHTRKNNICMFSRPVRISEQPPGPKNKFGAGHGVARVALSGYGEKNLFAVWADKRDFQEGYDIYGASMQSGNVFGRNVRVQDDFGANYRQWHATVSGHANGQLIVAWTDERDGTKDIWYSWLEDGEWSDDIAIPGASGKGIQDHPSITLDTAGNLHIAWVHREVNGGPTQIRYVFGFFITE